MELFSLFQLIVLDFMVATLLFWITALNDVFIQPQQKAVFSMTKKSWINPLYATCPAPNGSQTESVTSWWTNWSNYQLKSQIIPSRVCWDQARNDYDYVVCLLLVQLLPNGNKILPFLYFLIIYNVFTPGCHLNSLQYNYGNRSTFL